jgi:hypothetical protein
MEWQEVERRLAAVSLPEAVVIWQDDPGIVGVCWVEHRGADLTPIRKALKGLPTEQAFMSPDSDPGHMCLRVYDPPTQEGGMQA